MQIKVIIKILLFIKFTFKLSEGWINEEIKGPLNQLLELLKSRDKDLIDGLYELVDMDECNTQELRYLTVVSALIDYYMFP